jgi:hypothetical protein
MSANKTDVDAIRIALMGSYTSQVTNHIGYVIAISIATAGATINKDIWQILLGNRLLFSISVGVFFGILAYLLLRIGYWSYLGAKVISVTEREANIDGATSIEGMQIWIINECKRCRGIPN